MDLRSADDGRAGHGGRQRHAGLVLRRRPLPRGDGRRRPRGGAGRRGRRHPRHRRRVHPSRLGPGDRRRRSCCASSRSIRRVAASGTGAQLSVDTSKVEVAEAALAAGATYVNDVTAFRASPGPRRPRRRRRRRLLSHAHARRTPHDAGRPPLRRRRRRRAGLPGGAPGVRRARGGPGGPHLPRSGHRLRQDDRPQPRAAAPPGRRSFRSAGPSSSGRRASRSSAG